jgi:hypothetical protein
LIKIRKHAKLRVFYPRIISWLGWKNLFQTFASQDNSEIEQEIKEIKKLLDETNSAFASLDESSLQSVDGND